MKNGWREWLLLGVWMIAFASVAQGYGEYSPWSEDFAGGMSISGLGEKPEDVQAMKLTRYVDGSVLIQQFDSQGEKRLLRLAPENMGLVYGLNDEELSGSNPYLMSTLAFFPIMVPLMETYPQGYAAVPEEWETSSGVSSENNNIIWKMQARRVERQGKMIVQVRVTMENASKRNDGQGFKPIEVTGTWTRQREPALPDSFDLTGWQGQPEQYAGVRTLGELRRMMAQAKNVTGSSGAGGE